MTLLRLLNPQGIAGIAASLCLALLLVLQKGETRHWKERSGHYEQLYRDSEVALAGTAANYGAATEQARAADKANAGRVVAQQNAINERISDDYEARLASARAAAANLHVGRLRVGARTAAADPGHGGGAPVPGLAVAAGTADQAAGEDRLPDALIATEQAIQLDELIKWVKAQAEVDPNKSGN
jgi:hypothetical protein